MERDSLIKEIEKLRHKLEMLFVTRERVNQEVITVSGRLDQLIVSYLRLK